MVLEPSVLLVLLGEVGNMKNIKRTQMKSFEGDTLAEFTDNFNKGMEWVGRFSSEYKEPVIDIATLRGYVIYTETARLPENYRDRLELENITLTCGECKHFNHIKYHWGSCPYCKGDLRSNDEACDRLFDEWERNGDCWINEGDIDRYEQIVKTTNLDSVRRADKSKGVSY